MRQISLLESEIGSSRRELSAYTANDPERYEALQHGAKVAQDSANRWTDNIFSLKGWANKKFSGMDQQLTMFFKQHGVGEDFDYLS